MSAQKVFSIVALSGLVLYLATFRKWKCSFRTYINTSKHLGAKPGVDTAENEPRKG